MGSLSTGSPTWDVIVQVGIAVGLVLTIVLLIRNYRGRR
jgi:low affinity Fe/Cu permease